jgi:hypothetical protein
MTVIYSRRQPQGGYSDKEIEFVGVWKYVDENLARDVVTENCQMNG